MSINYATAQVGQLVRQRPNRARLFEKFGIDYCCQGKTTLGEACQRRGLDTAQVYEELTDLDAAAADVQDQSDWSVAPLSQLIDHIIRAHHTYLRLELPRLENLLAKVAAAHAANHPELRELRQVFTALENELTPHMLKEEQILFPWIIRLERSQQTQAATCGSINNPIRMMEHEHQLVGQLLARMRWLTANYMPPPDACPTYCALLASLAELERDLHRHIHKENNILFSRAAELESPLPDALLTEITP
jgi:regulator of cell morphogenesis and NO signaling